MKLTLTAVNVVIGFTAILLTLRTLRFRRLPDPAAGTDTPSSKPLDRRASGAVELAEYRPRRLCRQSRDGLQLLLRGGEKAVGRAEVVQDRTPAGRPDALQRVEDRPERARIPLLPVERDREAMRLVADALEQLQPGIVAVEQDRLRTAGHEHLLLALRERDDGDARQPAVAWIASSAAASCPLPPSITTRFGTAAKLSS